VEIGTSRHERRETGHGPALVLGGQLIVEAVESRRRDAAYGAIDLHLPPSMRDPHGGRPELECRVPQVMDRIIAGASDPVSGRPASLDKHRVRAGSSS
jgi:hypothetical protein